MSKSSRQLSRTNPASPLTTAPTADRIGTLLEEIRLLEIDTKLLEEERPALQARLYAAVAGLYDQIVAARQELMRLLERRMNASPADRRLQRDGVELIFDLARDLEERFGTDVSEFTNRWGGSSPDEEPQDDGDDSWTRPDEQLFKEAPTKPKRTPKGIPDPEAAAKGIYRSLARELHPDKNRDESLREHRTDLMRQLSLAWQARDLGTLLQLLHAHGSTDAKAGAMDAASLKACVQGLEDQRASLQEKLRTLRHRQLPQGVMDWMPLVRDPSGFEKVLRRYKAPAREELEFLRAVRAWWLRPGGLEECLNDPPQGLC